MKVLLDTIESRNMYIEEFVTKFCEDVVWSVSNMPA